MACKETGERDQRASLGNSRLSAPSGFAHPRSGYRLLLPAEPLPVPWHRASLGTARRLGI